MKIYDTYRKSLEKSPLKPIIEMEHNPNSNPRIEANKIVDWMYSNVSVGLYTAIATEIIERELNSEHPTLKVKIVKS